MDRRTFIRRYLYAYSIAMFAIPAIGAALDIFLGVYRAEEIFNAVVHYSLYYIIALYVLGIYLSLRALRSYSLGFEQAIARQDGATAELYAHKFSRLILYSLLYILLYTQGGPFSVNYYLQVDGIRELSRVEHFLTYASTLPTILIILFPVYFFVYDLLGRYLAPQGIVINLFPMRLRILVLGMVTPLLIDVMLILFFHDRTGYFSYETFILWLALMSIAAGSTYLTYLSFSHGLRSLHGPLAAQTMAELNKATITPDSLDELGLLSKGWNLLLTQYREAHLALREEQSFSNTIVNNANAIFVVMDNTGAIIEFNKGCENTTGYKAAEIIGQKFWDFFIADEEIEAVKDIFANLVKQPTNNSYQNYWLTKNGGRRFIDWSNSSIQGEEGRVKYIISIGIDITDKHDFEEELRRSKDYLDRAQAIAHIGHWVWTIKTNELDWSNETYRIFGLEPQSIEPNYPAFLERIHPEDVDKVINAVNTALEESNSYYKVQHRIILPAGEIRTVQEQGEVYRDSQGTPLQVVGTVLDVTERVRAETDILKLNAELEQRVQQRTHELEISRQYAEQASQAKTEFLSRVSHELRTPMNAILGFAHLLQISNAESLLPEQREYIDEILNGGNHLLDLINELLFITRIERGQLNLESQDFSVHLLFQETLQLVQPVLQAKHINLINNSCQDDDRIIHTDKTRLKQVLINLLSNAAKYNHDGGSITLNCNVGQDEFCVEVSDTGIGIPADKLETIFMPFMRVNPYSPVEGSGIGLAVCKQIVEAMHGRIGVESEPGRGSRFWIRIPLQ